MSKTLPQDINVIDFFKEFSIDLENLKDSDGDNIEHINQINQLLYDTFEILVEESDYYEEDLGKDVVIIYKNLYTTTKNSQKYYIIFDFEDYSSINDSGKMEDINILYHIKVYHEEDFSDHLYLTIIKKLFTYKEYFFTMYEDEAKEKCLEYTSNYFF